MAPVMAKKKPKPRGVREQVLGIRAFPEWKDWLVRFAEHCRSDMVDVVDDALADYAKKMEFEPPPKR